jgi:hypothetical protein
MHHGTAILIVFSSDSCDLDARARCVNTDRNAGTALRRELEECS